MNLDLLKELIDDINIKAYFIFIIYFEIYIINIY